MTKVKINILDNSDMRKLLDMEYEKSSQVKLCKYSILLSKHILELIKYPNMNDETIKEGLHINEQWQKGNARMYDVRQAALKIHRMAKAGEDDITRTALRVVGHAVAAGHMKEHAMVASDYAIKVVNLLYPDDIDAVRDERLWQISCLRSIAD